ncbi:unnamed protein product [Parnassius apollo]|uniref:(apollo) hypothetical protein n=1 Tax=Parnassius apollo TaxID=110799 RepID=A0A8S3WK05_PARAO|nr:unnamed protein product [Parnassius apollo]
MFLQDPSQNEEKHHAVSNNHYVLNAQRYSAHNMTYLDKSENLLRVPKKYYEERKRKQKTLKKLPKRTVQKIIKQTKSKYRRSFNQATIQPTQVSEDFNLIDKSLSDKLDNKATTQVNQRKKSRKNIKLMRYPMPFQKISYHNRYRRDNERDVYILNDLDEIEFLSNEDGYDVVNAHVKNYW